MEDQIKMVVNIFDTANEMSRQMVETQEYQDLKVAVEELLADEAAVALFRDFQKQQAEAQHKQMQGQQPSEDEIKAIQDMAKKVSAEASIMKLMEQEKRLDQMIQQINQNLTSPIQSLYNDLLKDPE